MRRTLLAILFVTLAACGGNGHAKSTPTTTPTSSRTAGPSALQVLQTYVDDFNNGDIAGAVAQFAPNAEFVTPLGGCDPCVGPAVRDKLSRAAASQTKIVITNPRTVGNTVTVHTELRSPTLPSGIERAIGTATVSVLGAKITRLDQQYDARDPQTARLLNLTGAATPSTSA